MTDADQRPEVRHVYQNHHLDSPRWDAFKPRPGDIVIVVSVLADNEDPKVAETARAARRDGLEVVVTLCHLRENARQEIWDQLAPETRAFLLPRLDQVHLTSTATTREYARDINARLLRAARPHPNMLRT